MASSSAERSRLSPDRAATRARVERLRAFAADAEFLPILIHADPDPDAIAAALAVRALLRRTPQQSPILCTGEIARPENRRMAELLRVRITPVSPEELDLHERMVVVDTQPSTVPDDHRAFAVIDHHPIESDQRAEFEDIRPEVGATSTILTEYLRADDPRRIRPPLATALLYGIRTDTATLSRGATPADVRAYAFLQSRADAELLRRIERPAHPPEAIRAFGRALAEMAIEGDVCAAWVGTLAAEHAHILPDLADFCLEMRGLAWVAAAARIDDRIIANVRHLDGEPGAGDVAEILTRDEGSGGGHTTMARVMMPGDWLGSEEGERGEAARRLLERLKSSIESARGEAR